jgi:hypothetical protein
MGDAVSCGLTKRIRVGLGYDDVVDQNSRAYFAGQVAGEVVNTALTTVNPCQAAGLTRVAVRGLHAAQSAGNGVNAANAFNEGDVLGGLLYLGAAYGSARSAMKSCFAAGTPLLTPDGFKPIEQFQVGDYLLSAPEGDPEAAPEPKRVEELFTSYSPLLELHVAGRTIRTTGEHPFFVLGRGWTPANELMVGDRLRSHNALAVVVDRVSALDDEVAVYNVRVEDWHTYFLGDPSWGFSVWAHNACVSRIHDDPGLVREAKATGRTHQASIDRLTGQLGSGNFNPGIGTRGVFGNVLEARARGGARVYFRTLANGDAEILAKSSKANQNAVIKILEGLYGR